MTTPHFTVTPQARQRVIAQHALEWFEAWLKHYGKDQPPTLPFIHLGDVDGSIPEDAWTPAPDFDHPAWRVDYDEVLDDVANKATELAQASATQVFQAIDRERRKFRLIASGEYCDTALEEATTRGPCDACAGTGKDRLGEPCSVCNGTGQTESLHLDQLDFDALMLSESLSPNSTDEELNQGNIPCERCEGTGVGDDDGGPCPACDGTGWVEGGAA